MFITQDTDSPPSCWQFSPTRSLSRTRWPEGGEWPGVGGWEKAVASGTLGWALSVLPSSVWAARLRVWGHGWRQQRPGDKKTRNDETPLPQSCSANFVSAPWFLSAVKVFQALLDEILYQQEDACFQTSILMMQTVATETAVRTANETVFGILWHIYTMYHFCPSALSYPQIRQWSFGFPQTRKT